MPGLRRPHFKDNVLDLRTSRFQSSDSEKTKKYPTFRPSTKWAEEQVGLGVRQMYLILYWIQSCCHHQRGCQVTGRVTAGKTTKLGGIGWAGSVAGRGYSSGLVLESNNDRLV